MKKLVILTALALTSAATPALARAKNFDLAGKYELSGGLGFAADVSYWTPGGFKWFNDFGIKLSRLTWLNLQFNIVAGGTGGRGACYYDRRGNWVCDKQSYFGGTALEFAGGVKLKWKLPTVPVQIHAKFGGALPLIFFDGFRGVGIVFRGGVGARYFFVPTFGVGAELVHNLGPAFLNRGAGVQVYASVEMNFGVEWRF